LHEGQEVLQTAALRRPRPARRHHRPPPRPLERLDGKEEKAADAEGSGSRVTQQARHRRPPGDYWSFYTERISGEGWRPNAAFPSGCDARGFFFAVRILELRF